jgi:hypothetical protein
MSDRRTQKSPEFHRDKFFTAAGELSRVNQLPGTMAGLTDSLGRAQNR